MRTCGNPCNRLQGARGNQVGNIHSTVIAALGNLIELLKDMEVEHWCFGCVLKGKQGRLEAFQSLMYKLLHMSALGEHAT
ncbi:hypothetical protein CY35_14G013400 [Sphagnum magellanicum]|nr:hypothetical protein CY35_14G013400 [Sphagnum magellanicum]